LSFRHLGDTGSRGSASLPASLPQAFTKGASEPFIGTLDYIFLGRGGAAPKSGPAEAASPPVSPATGAWRVLGVKPLKTLTAVEGVLSYPSAEEPSDHVLIWADLQLA
jgi:hypothetical protein